MSKQIAVRCMIGGETQLRKMHEEAITYLENIGFAKESLLAITDNDTTFRSFLFYSGDEKVMLEYKKDMYDEMLKLVFSPLDIKFVYDILLMRFNQLAAEEKNSVFIFNE